jgi:hypothetical protein
MEGSRHSVTEGINSAFVWSGEDNHDRLQDTPRRSQDSNMYLQKRYEKHYRFR